MDAELVVDHGVVARPHLAGADRVERGAARLPQPRGERCVVGLVRSGSDLRSDDVGEGRLAHHLAQELHPGDGRLLVELGAEIVGEDLRRVARIGRAEREPPAALRVDRADADGDAVVVADPRLRPNFGQWRFAVFSSAGMKCAWMSGATSPGRERRKAPPS